MKFGKSEVKAGRIRQIGRSGGENIGIDTDPVVGQRRRNERECGSIEGNAHTFVGQGANDEVFRDGKQQTGADRQHRENGEEARSKFVEG